MDNADLFQPRTTRNTRSFLAVESLSKGIRVFRVFRGKKNRVIRGKKPSLLESSVAIEFIRAIRDEDREMT
jgi:hypothetical protein